MVKNKIQQIGRCNLTRIFRILTIMVLLISTVIPARAYQSNYGEWTVNYEIDLYYEYPIVSEEELEYINSKETLTVGETLDLILRARNYLDNSQYNLSDFDIDISNVDIDRPITRGEFAEYIIKSLDKDQIAYMNVISDGIIPDVDISNKYYNSIYDCYRYGFMQGETELGHYNSDGEMKTIHILTVLQRVINPNLRTPISLYSNDTVEIQDENFPLIYRNHEKELSITINNERYFNSNCYVAHIIMRDPAHLKTIYSDLFWNDIGAEAYIIDGLIHPIFMINGDFRNSYYGENLGIVRARRAVNDKEFKNCLTYDVNGNFDIDSYKNADEALSDNIRETFTFGPTLIKDGKMQFKYDARESKAPRTFIGQIYREDGLLEYYFVVADGRSLESLGLTNYEMASILSEYKCDLAYNLDGGGSSVMYFNGKCVNTPCYGERADADYIYIK